MDDRNRRITLTVAELQHIVNAHLAQAEAQRIMAAARPAIDNLNAQMTAKREDHSQEMPDDPAAS
ncbi:MAG: hypothetical protein ACREC4_02780 [Methylocella sp.]